MCGLALWWASYAVVVVREEPAQRVVVAAGGEAALRTAPEPAWGTWLNEEYEPCSATCGRGSRLIVKADCECPEETECECDPEADNAPGKEQACSSSTGCQWLCRNEGCGFLPAQCSDGTGLVSDAFCTEAVEQGSLPEQARVDCFSDKTCGSEDTLDTVCLITVNNPKNDMAAQCAGADVVAVAAQEVGGAPQLYKDAAKAAALGRDYVGAGVCERGYGEPSSNVFVYAKRSKRHLLGPLPVCTFAKGTTSFMNTKGSWLLALPSVRGRLAFASTHGDRHSGPKRVVDVQAVLQLLAAEQAAARVPELHVLWGGDFNGRAAYLLTALTQALRASTTGVLSLAQVLAAREHNFLDDENRVDLETVAAPLQVLPTDHVCPTYYKHKGSPTPGEKAGTSKALLGCAPEDGATPELSQLGARQDGFKAGRAPSWPDRLIVSPGMRCAASLGGLAAGTGLPTAKDLREKDHDRVFTFCALEGTMAARP